MIDLTGQSFTRLTVIAYVGMTEHRDSLWLCRCSCGTEKIVRGRGLRSGSSRSCGCLQRESVHGEIRHGHASRGAVSAEYRVFLDARRRCLNPTRKDYKNYGGRGIEMRFQTFQEFYDEVGPRPSPEYSIDRYPNNNEHYEKGNVRWATRSQQ